jgi:hypothetical protein
MSAISRRTEPITQDAARAVFGEFWFLSILNRKDGRDLCICEAPANGRSMMNILGSVTDVATCDDCHAKIDGMCCDSFPSAEDIKRWRAPSSTL